jgi:hypothetical protein
LRPGFDQNRKQIHQQIITILKTNGKKRTSPGKPQRILLRLRQPLVSCRGQCVTMDLASAKLSRS